MLISCPACTKEVSTYAHSCPSCGHPIRRPSEGLGRLALGVIMFFVIIAAGGAFSFIAAFFSLLG
jgi:hypothetical protein